MTLILHIFFLVGQLFIFIIIRFYINLQQYVYKLSCFIIINYAEFILGYKNVFIFNTIEKIIDFNFGANYNFYFLLPEDDANHERILKKNGANYKYCKYFGSILVQIDYSQTKY